MRKILLVIVVALLVSACGAEPIRTPTSGNKDVKVEVIAEFDGLVLYRILDGSERTIYVAQSASQIRTTWMEQQGKTAVERESVTVR